MSEQYRLPDRPRAQVPRPSTFAEFHKRQKFRRASFAPREAQVRPAPSAVDACLWGGYAIASLLSPEHD